MYTVRIYDEQLHLIDVLDGQVSGRFRVRRNNAGDAGFSYPYDGQLVSAFALATNIAVYRNDKQKFAGYISERDFSGNTYSLSAEGHEARLRALRTPKMWTLWDGSDLADVARDLLKKFQIKRYSTQQDWEEAHELFQVDTETEPGWVMVEYEPHPADPDNNRPKEMGYIVLRLDLGEEALGPGRLVRWSEEIGHTERVKVQSRAADSQEELDAIDWETRPEFEALHVGMDVQENETLGVALPASGRWVDIRFNLYANDRTSVRRDSEGNIVGYGFTPALKGVEIIWREPSEIKEGDIPTSTGIEVQDYEFDRADHLQVLAELCDDLGWEFKVRHEEHLKQFVLDFGQQTEGDWIPEIGKDRAHTSERPIVLQEKDNCQIPVFRDSKNRLATVLHCWGAGLGAEQLYARLEADQETIDQYGYIETDYIDAEAETLEQLIESGQAEIDRLSHPEISFEAAPVVVEDWEPYGLGDTVTVIRKWSETLNICRIYEERREWGRKEQIRLGLDDYLENPFAGFIDREKHKITPFQPDPARQVTAEGQYGYIVLTWRGVGDLYAIRFRPANSPDEWQYADTKERKFTHTQLDPGASWEYQVAVVRNDRISGWSDTASAVVLTIPPGDIDVEAPDPPGALSVTEVSYLSKDGTMILAARLEWTPSTSAYLDSQMIRRKEVEEGTWHTIMVLDPDTSAWVDTVGLESDEYAWRVVAQNIHGVCSEPSDHVTLALAGKTVPPPNVSFDTCSFVDRIVLRWFPVQASDLAGYEVRTDTAFGSDDEHLIFRGMDISHTIEDVEHRSYTFYIKAFDRSGNYSEEHSQITLERPTPDTPNAPEITEFFNVIWLQIEALPDSGIKGYYLYITASDGEGNPLGGASTEKRRVTAGRVIHQASPGSSFLFEVSAYDVLGDGDKSQAVEGMTKQVETEDLNDASVTAQKLAEDAVENKHIKDVSGVKVLAGTITEAKVNWQSHLIF